MDRLIRVTPSMVACSASVSRRSRCQGPGPSAAVPQPECLGHFGLDQLDLQSLESDRDIVQRSIGLGPRTQALGALEREKLIPGLHVKLSVEGGWLTISGDAPHKVERSAAECVVRCVPGVKGVTNRIVVATTDRR